MTECNLCRNISTSRLNCNNWNFFIKGSSSSNIKRFDIGNSFDMKAYCIDSIVIEHRINNICNICICLIAKSKHVGNWKPDRLHCNIKAYIATLCNNCNPTQNWLTTMNIRPQSNSIKTIDKAITVRSN